MDISEVAKRSGLPGSTLRFYEEKGLIASAGRKGLRRTYKPDILERLALIALGRAAGFSLDEIGRMLGQMCASGSKPQIDRRALSARARELDRAIVRLSAMRDGLKHAARCPAPSHMECPTFRRLMQKTASGKIAATKKPLMR